jgi:hypothetical protein
MRLRVLLPLVAALALAGCGSPTTPLAAPSGAQSPAGMSAYAPAPAHVTVSQVPAAPAGVVADSGNGGVQELSASVPNNANHPATLAQGLCVGQIQSQLSSLVSLGQVGMPMSGMEAITQSQNLIQFFAPACTVIPWPEAQPITGANFLSGEIGQWLGGMQIGKFQIKQQYIKVSPDRTQGRAIVCLKVDITYLDRVVRYEGWYATYWVPIKGTWLIQNVKPVDVSSATRVGDTVPQLYFAPYWGSDWGYY